MGALEQHLKINHKCLIFNNFLILTPMGVRIKQHLTAETDVSAVNNFSSAPIGCARTTLKNQS
jgi:hypothetical protein